MTRWLRIMVERATEETITMPAEAEKPPMKMPAWPTRVAGLQGQVENEIIGIGGIPLLSEQAAQGDGNNEDVDQEACRRESRHMASWICSSLEFSMTMM